MTEKYSIKEALEHYRYLTAFVANAIDAMEWYICGSRISSEFRSITQSRMLTITMLAHMDKALDAYRQLCELEGDTRPYQLVMRKYVTPAIGAENGRPYSNEALAMEFGISDDTVGRDLKEARRKLKILFFGLPAIHTAESCGKSAVDVHDIL